MKRGEYSPPDSLRYSFSIIEHHRRPIPRLNMLIKGEAGEAAGVALTGSFHDSPIGRGIEAGKRRRPVSRGNSILDYLL